jgi:hypothetical protein
MTGQMIIKPEVLEGVLEKFREWDRRGYTIILITGRKESARKLTEDQLQKFGLFYDHLIMGLPRGPRIIINDMKEDSLDKTAGHFCVERNKGIGDIEI